MRGFERRAERPSDDRYGRTLRVKVNVAEVLRRELARRSWKHEPVVVGAATDPYQPAEGRYRLTRACLSEFSAASNPFSIITRGPMIVRDVDVLAEAAARADVSVNVSIPTLDPLIWRRTEPGTAPPRQRLKAVAALVGAGISAGVAIAPVLPGLSDDPALLAAVVRGARDAGATFVWSNVLNLRPGTREHFLENLARDWPELLPMYERLYACGGYLKTEQTAPITDEIRRLRARFGIADRRWRRLAPPRPLEQLALAL